ncbi:hypothetical protein CCAX7_49490 [Capsulimonas corticalis]|uniref:Uncharacterized protein n=1 Tax=Capsulimonas corticalis TaxID=2219043 RepID=A0A9N7L8P7_9BACT|nr:hypothetical protein [Capsulimonas corticalis]BDI32898.1 hypothetical protein CCAX7_49490 [Capsulimonas corticalis]
MTRLNGSFLCAATLAAVLLTGQAAIAQAGNDNTPVDAPPAPQQPAPVTLPGAPVTTGGATAVTADVNIAARDPRTLHPMLIPTDREMLANLDAGRAIGKSKQDFIDLLDMSRRAYQFRSGGILGETRRETGIVTWLTPGTEARWRGFLEQRDFADSAGRDADFKALEQSVTAPQRTLTFIVEITDLFPRQKGKKKKDETPIDPATAFNKLDGIQFVLSDDRENNFKPLQVYAPTQLIARQQFYDNIAGDPTHVLGSNPFEIANTVSPRLVKRRDSYNDLAGFFVVVFDAFNADGTARINRDTKSVSLRVITSDPKFASFPLDKLP